MYPRFHPIATRQLYVCQLLVLYDHSCHFKHGTFECISHLLLPLRFRGGGREDDKTEAYLGCLSDGNGFVAGVDRRGKVVARNVSTGESRVLLATETPGGANFACMDFNSGILALATGGVGCAAATSIDLFALSDAGGDVPVAVGVSA